MGYRMSHFLPNFQKRCVDTTLSHTLGSEVERDTYFIDCHRCEGLCLSSETADKLSLTWGKTWYGHQLLIAKMWHICDRNMMLDSVTDKEISTRAADRNGPRDYSNRQQNIPGTAPAHPLETMRWPLCSQLFLLLQWNTQQKPFTQGRAYFGSGLEGNGSIVVGKLRREAWEAAGHISPTARKQKDECHARTRISDYEMSLPTVKAPATSSINLI